MIPNEVFKAFASSYSFALCKSCSSLPNNISFKKLVDYVGAKALENGERKGE